MRIAVISFTKQGAELSDRIKTALEGQGHTETICYTKCSAFLKDPGQMTSLEGRMVYVSEPLADWTEKQFEQRIMNLMPYLIVLYVDLSSPGFFSQMYETAVGRVVMTGCLVVYLLAWRVSGKILQIEV